MVYLTTTNASEKKTRPLICSRMCYFLGVVIIALTIVLALYGTFDAFYVACGLGLGCALQLMAVFLD